MKTNFSKFCNLKLELKNGTKFWLKFRTWRVISQFIPIKKLERKGNSFFFNADTYDLLLTYPAANFSVFFPSAKKKKPDHICCVFGIFCPQGYHKQRFRWMFRLNLGLCFYFTSNPEGKKNRKYPPTYLFLQTTVTFICFSTENKKNIPLYFNKNLAVITLRNETSAQKNRH